MVVALLKGFYAGKAPWLGFGSKVGMVKGLQGWASVPRLVGLAGGLLVTALWWGCTDRSLMPWSGLLLEVWCGQPGSPLLQDPH